MSVEPPTLSFAQLKTYIFPPENHIIGNGILKKGSTLVLSGSPKSYKSFTLNTIATQLLAGGDLFGTFTNHANQRQSMFDIKPVSRVLLIEQEVGYEDMRDRLLTQCMGLTPEQRDRVENGLFIHSCDYNLRLDNEDGAKRIEDIVVKVSPEIVCFDTLAKFHTCNENDSQDMSKIMLYLRIVSQNLNFTSILSHHNTKPGIHSTREGLDQLRGSSAIAADVDTGLIASIYNRNSSIIKIEPILRRGKPVHPFLLKLNSETLRMDFYSWKCGEKPDPKENENWLDSLQ